MSLSALSSGDSPTKRSLKRHAGKDDADTSIEQEYVSKSELYKRNALLSRLGSIADVVAMYVLPFPGLCVSCRR